MPLDKFVLLLLIVLGAAAVTVWFAAVISASLAWSAGWFLLVPAILVLAVFWRVIADRIGRDDDDRYDRTPR